MHTIDLHYLYLSGNLMLRPRRVVTVRAANAAPEASLLPTRSTTRF
jgi:hypothetical protein